jgi:hypothetical protein
VASIAHFGDVLQYVVTTSGHREVVVLAPRSTGARLGVGDDVWCTWKADDVYQFSDRQAELVLPEAVTAAAAIATA